MLQARENLMEAIQAFLKKYDQIPLKEKSMALLLDEERFLIIKKALEEEHNQPKNIKELLLKLINDLQILNEIRLKQEEQVATVIAITPDLPIKDSLVMEDEHLNSISVTESDEENESSVKDHNLTPSESDELSEDLSNNKSKCDVPICDDSSPNFTAFSNPLFDSNDDFTYSNNESFSEEDVPKENYKFYSNPLFEFNEEIISKSFLNRDTSMASSPKIDSLVEEFSGELAHINLIPLGID
nr:hypothetical protein [Tanacetum cinerariifolium]